MKIDSAKFVKSIRGTDPILEDKIPKIAFVGRSNVGKSSFINSICQRKSLAFSSSKPGKTREMNFYLINNSFYLIDLPGYGYAKVRAKLQEKLGKLLIWYLTEQEFKPEGVIMIVDSKTGLSEHDREMISLLKEYKYHFVVVANKVDRATQAEIAKIKKELSESEVEYYLYSSKEVDNKSNFSDQVLYNLVSERI